MGLLFTASLRRFTCGANLDVPMCVHFSALGLLPSSSVCCLRCHGLCAVTLWRWLCCCQAHRCVACDVCGHKFGTQPGTCCSTHSRSRAAARSTTRGGRYVVPSLRHHARPALASLASITTTHSNHPNPNPCFACFRQRPSPQRRVARSASRCSMCCADWRTCVWLHWWPNWGHRPRTPRRFCSATMCTTTSSGAAARA